MGGSGGGGAFVNRSPSELRDLVRKAEDKTTGDSFDAELGEILGKLLGSYNGRNVDLVGDRLEELKTALKNEIEGTFDQLYGGSVAKHTYVDGLSDIDSLVILDNTALEGKSPQKALARIDKVIAKRLGNQAKVEHGRMAVTVTYPDGMEIQLLPALKGAAGRVRVPSSRVDGWSEIDPVKFQAALTRHNKQFGGKLVPVIKLAKAINGQLPKAQQLSGYHMESLGIAAFRNYTGEKTSTAMLPFFFERARELVLAPIRDSTGQSVHVDGYLGVANSDARQAASHVLGRIARRMRNATTARSDAQWRALFGLDEP
jgi:hypothetical protein